MHKTKIRQFESGATRSQSDGKLEYYGFREPLVELSFGKYMNIHRVQENGELRTSNNWWKGWSKEISLQSLVRHVEDLQALHAGYIVVKIRNKDGETTEYVKSLKELVVEKGDTVELIDEEECVNAVRFNCGSYLLELLKNK